MNKNQHDQLDVVSKAKVISSIREVLDHQIVDFGIDQREITSKCINYDSSFRVLIDRSAGGSMRKQFVHCSICLVMTYLVRTMKQFKFVVLLGDGFDIYLFYI